MSSLIEARLSMVIEAIKLQAKEEQWDLDKLTGKVESAKTAFLLFKSIYRPGMTPEVFEKHLADACHISSEERILVGATCEDRPLEETFINDASISDELINAMNDTCQRCNTTRGELASFIAPNNLLTMKQKSDLVNRSFHKCMSCQKAIYCSSGCQRADWSRHKVKCIHT